MIPTQIEQIEALAAQLSPEDQQRVTDCTVCLARVVKEYGKAGVIALALLSARPVGAP